MKESRKAAPKTKPAIVTALRPGSSTPVVTWSIIALCVVIYIAQLFSNGVVTNALFYHPVLTETQPWRMVTSLFVHSPSSYLHIIFNMFSLFVMGPIIEMAIGRWRFLVLYLLSGIGGSVAVLLLAPTIGVLGASGAIFGLLGAFFVIQRSMGGRNTQIVIVIVLNLVIGFVIPNVAWQAHVGGILVGGLVAFVLLRTRTAAKRNEQRLLLFAVFVGLVVLTVIGVGLLQSRLI
jgi:membrane associated rhomboid family serine protease